MTEVNVVKEEGLQKSILSKFADMEGTVTIKRPRRIFVEVELSNFRNVFDYITKDLNFNIMCMITGLDEGENLSFIYHLAHFNGIMIDLKTYAPKNNPVIKTVTDTFPGSDLYERELVDLLGAKIEGLPNGTRYPLPDGWPEGQYPLRKDWNREMLDKKKEN